MGYMKKIHYLFFLTFLLVTDNFGKIINNPPTKTSFTPENTVFMFDVDGVLVERSFWQNWHEYWNIMKDCSVFDLLQFFGWHLLHIPTLFTMVQQEDIEKYLDRLTQDWPFLLYETPTGTILERLKKLISAGYPKQETLDVLLNLQHQGFPITITTNQARSTFNRLVNNGVLPDFSTYALIFTADRCPYLPYIKKPRKEYYECFMNTFEQKGFKPEHYIFIDDTYANVVASAQEGIISIHFNNCLQHPAQQLIDDLATLGIIVATEEDKEKGREKIPAFS